ncbi:MAG: hypothetical protein Q7S31_01115 [bacterium]|nr:hypothetical protein [bacterium]
MDFYSDDEGRSGPVIKIFIDPVTGEQNLFPQVAPSHMQALGSMSRFFGGFEPAPVSELNQIRQEPQDVKGIDLDEIVRRFKQESDLDRIIRRFRVER